MVDDPVELERRLHAGEWLSPGEVAVLTGLGRTTIHGLLTAGNLGYRKKPGGHRICDPADVRRLLAEVRKVHRRAGTGPDTT